MTTPEREKFEKWVNDTYPNNLMMRNTLLDNKSFFDVWQAALSDPAIDEELTPNQRRALSRGLSALEAMAGLWAVEIRLQVLAENLACAPDGIRAKSIAAMIEQAFIEGAYRHYLDHKDAAPTPPEVEPAPAENEKLRKILREMCLSSRALQEESYFADRYTHENRLERHLRACAEAENLIDGAAEKKGRHASADKLADESVFNFHGYGVLEADGTFESDDLESAEEAFASIESHNRCRFRGGPFKPIRIFYQVIGDGEVPADDSEPLCPRPSPKAALSDEDISAIGSTVPGIRHLPNLLDEDQWATAECALFEFARKVRGQP